MGAPALSERGKKLKEQGKTYSEIALIEGSAPPTVDAKGEAPKPKAPARKKAATKSTAKKSTAKK